MSPLLVLFATAALTQPAQQPMPMSIRAMTSAPGPTGTVLTLQLTGDVKPSTGRLVENPWRLYFDLPGVVPGRQRTLNVESGPISHVRIGINQPAPPVTRVVIELTRRVTWRVEAGPAPGEFRVIIDGPASVGAAAKKPAGRVIYAPAQPPPPARDRRAGIRRELFEMAPLLEAMRAWTGPSDGALAAMLAKAEELGTGARAMRITGSAGDVALVAAIDGVLAAARARAQALADGTEQSRANAITAASGALLLLAHARQQQPREP